ncbi:type II secretion system F family protein [[Mycobacterium] nativiensis]|uniref:Type II secretion system F family protein n=1 Tax=[Mycobacterium] nativiensis TaxID=2855503 RepID=A0ABU5Y479_9MYCO|nr:type II secretion system F family protein [Mycolicibacter sp. MYC340]MEB3035020.1 type II secretion system F family protein [Mycolicibacter sp. MYC340]
MSAAAVLLACAVLAAAGPSMVRARAGLPRPDHPVRPRAAPGTDALALAAGLDVFALCLTAGMPVSGAAVATARSAPPQLSAVLRRGADLLALGADPSIAWSPPESTTGVLDPSTTAVLRLARRSGTSGVALAAGLGELAAQCRDDAGHVATAAAERAGVLIAGPLGLCFLPAFVCLGIVPVVAGLAGDVLRSGLL